MPTMTQAARAYEAAATHRSQREQEADVFRRATGALKAARDAGPIPRVRAIADNRRLWMTVTDLMRDPLNPLPQDLRASIVSVGLAVQREMDSDTPDFDFLIAINENIAAGLSEIRADHSSRRHGERAAMGTSLSYLTSLYGRRDRHRVRQPAGDALRLCRADRRIRLGQNPVTALAVGGEEPDAGHQGDGGATGGKACGRCIHRRRQQRQDGESNCWPTRR